MSKNMGEEEECAECIDKFMDIAIFFFRCKILW